MGMMYYYTLAGALVIILIILLLLVRRQRQRGAGDGQSAAPKRKKKKSTPAAKAAKAKRSAKKPTVQEPEARVSEAARPTIAAAQRENPRKSSMATRRPEEMATEYESVAEPQTPADWQNLISDETHFHLNEDQVMRQSTYSTSESASGYRADPRQAWLEARLSLQSVLGWFTVTPSGNAQYSDQEYDPEVYLRFSKLLRQMIDSAQLVGMENWKDFVVHGTEGVILMIAIQQSAMAQEDYLVVFLDEESSIKSVLARIRQDD